MKRIFAYTVVYGKPSTLHIFEGKDALVSYAANSGRLEATEGNPTIDQLLKALGMTRVYASELNKIYYKLNHYYVMHSMQYAQQIDMLLELLNNDNIRVATNARKRRK